MHRPSARRPAASAVLVLACLPACGDAETSGAGSTSTVGPAAAACAPGEMPLEGGECQPAGIPPSLCGEGFEPDGAMGCHAILPPAPCPPGEMAIPGDIECRAVAPCADGEYGDIPIEATTQFVNAAYAGTGSDGTLALPWTTIQDGIDAAEPGAIVAIAAGSYAEWVDVRFKAVRLWGRCPSMVEIAGDSTEYAAVFLEDGAAGTEVRDLAIVGSQVGVTLSGSENILLDRLWIHDVASRGVNIQDDWGPTAIAVTGSLIEGAREFGVFVSSSKLLLEGSVVRDTHPVAGNFGRGLDVQASPSSKVRSDVTVRASVIERNSETAVYVAGSDAIIDRTVVRDTAAQESDGLVGHGITVENELETGESSTLVLSASIVERNRGSGVFVGASQALIESTVVRDTLPRDGDQQFGRGIAFQPDAGIRADATIRSSLIERNFEVGLFVSGTNASIEGLRVRDTRPRPIELDKGSGIVLQAQGPAAAAAIRWSIVERSHEVGIYASDYDATIDSSAVVDTIPGDGPGLFGDAVSLKAGETPRAMTVTGSLLQGSRRAAVSMFGGAVALEGDTLECNAIDLDAEPPADIGTGFSDLGGNSCGCGGERRVCQAVSSGLMPPQPLAPVEY